MSFLLLPPAAHVEQQSRKITLPSEESMRQASQPSKTLKINPGNGARAGGLRTTTATTNQGSGDKGSEQLNPVTSTSETALDRYDIAILRTLQDQARISNIDLANRIGLSAAPTWRRVKRLEQLGYIAGYRAELDRRLIGLGVLAFVRVDAERHNAQATAELERTLRQMPEVIACHYISGAGTFELQVVATDLDAYSRWTMSTLFKLPYVKDIHTSFSLGEVKAGAPLPLSHLKPGSSPPSTPSKGRA